ncbi:unnamed protein product [Dracunculus medinensis]|uniref:U6 small nuclear RNA (adenine-(43)-N(6))-methyltransferase n=1 Tax=Dracunculus medinensis TaxID=318479 RepID=A0A0N4ULR3_DRAME|nr:unnamed protein product [Dracunculus medinensis]
MLNEMVALNFRDANNVRILAKTLLRDDFGLNVELPPDCLVPRVPQRLNYIYWIDDQLKTNGLTQDVLGIDIGTGASCIYALLGAKLFGWSFIATDSDPRSLEVAKQNVESNGLRDKIEIAHVDKNRLIKDIVRSHASNNFTFCMCNPPFFEKEEFDEKFMPIDDNVVVNICNEGYKSVPLSATVAKINEVTVAGGEVAFISQLIDDSLALKRSVVIYTSMVGRKCSLLKLKKKLGRCSNVKYTFGTLSQGKTQRWILAWSFEPRINFLSTIKAYSPFKLQFPSADFGQEKSVLWAKQVLDTLKISYYQSDERIFVCDAAKNTWSNQRRKRRNSFQEKGGDIYQIKRLCLPPNAISCSAGLGVGDGQDSLSNAGNFNECMILDNAYNSKRFDSSIQTYLPLCEKSQSIVRFEFALSPNDKGFVLSWIDGSRNALHQINQYCKNQISKLDNRAESE